MLTEKGAIISKNIGLSGEPQNMECGMEILEWTTHSSPAENPREVVASPQRKNGDRGKRFDCQFIDDRENPANGPVSTTSQNTDVTEITKHL